MKHRLFIILPLCLSLSVPSCEADIYCALLSYFLSPLYGGFVISQCEDYLEPEEEFVDFVVDPGSGYGHPPLTDIVIRRSFSCGYTPGFTCENPEGEPGFCEDLQVDGSFNLGTYRAGFRPDTTGFWQGDLAEVVTEDDSDGASQGLRPCSGDKMLKFLGSGPGGPHPVGNTATMIQLIDLRPYKDTIEASSVKVVARALFDRVQVDSETDRRFVVAIRAYEGALASLPTQWVEQTWLDESVVRITSDNVRGWQEVIVELELPANTDFINIDVSAAEDVFNDGALPEFDGHFVDDVKVQLSR